MSWTALVPLKVGSDRKSRLAPRLSLDQRETLADALAAHVLARLREAPDIARIIVLAQRPKVGVEWRRDEGRGLNAELAAARDDFGAPLLVIHGDLPFLEIEDVAALLGAARGAGVAIAPDRHGRGTNAIALADHRPFRFAFGSRSRKAHAPGAIEVMRKGLALDVDTAADLDAAIRDGWRFTPGQ